MRSFARGMALLLLCGTANADNKAVLSMDRLGAPDLEVGGTTGIVGGTPVTKGEFPAVVALSVGNALCTGTLIDPLWVLTAAHCVDPAVVGLGSQAQVTANTTVIIGSIDINFGGGRQISAALTIKKAAFNVNNLGSNDVGLVKLSQAVTDVTPIKVNFNHDKSPVGLKPVLMVGFGATETGSVGKMIKVDGRTAISCSGVGSDTNLLCFSQVDGKGKCEGDSGGPSFADIDGQRQIVGITSFGDQNCQQFGADTRTDAERDFIVTNVGPQVEGCTTDPECGGNGKICFNGGCITEPGTPGGLGEDCTSGDQCGTGQCANGPGGQLCTMSCQTAAGNCPSGFECLDTGGGNGLCWPEDGGGCCDASGQGGATALLGFGLVALVLRRRR